MARGSIAYRSGWRELARFVSVAMTIAAVASACEPPAPLPGTSLGTYNVTATLGTNTCGTGIGAPSPWNFTAQMSENGTTLYWEMAGGTQLSNVMTSTTMVSITSIQTANVDSTEAGLPGPCDLEGTTAIDLTLAEGSPPASFTGTITYTFAAATGVASTTNCTDQLTTSGGAYDTLPCNATYAMTGTHQ